MLMVTKCQQGHSVAELLKDRTSVSSCRASRVAEIPNTVIGGNERTLGDTATTARGGGGGLEVNVRHH